MVENAISRRRFLEKAGKAGVVATGLILLPAISTSSFAQVEAVPFPQTSLEDVKDQFREAAYLRGGQIYLGKRISEVCVDETEGAKTNLPYKMFWQFAGLQSDFSGEQFKVIPTLSQLQQKGLDRKLGTGSYGVIIPPAIQYPDPDLPIEEVFYNRAQQFGITGQILNHIDKLKAQGIDPGLPMAPKYAADGVETYRFEGMAFQSRPDGIHHLFVGDIAKSAGLVPKDIWLPSPSDDAEVNLADYSYVPIRIRQDVRNNEVDDLIRWGASHMGISESYARKIVQCESEFKPTAANPTSSARGLWQILGDSANRARFRARGWDFDRDWADPIVNTIIAIDIMRAQGVRAWSCA